MRFLIITKSKHPFPPQMAPALFDAMAGWVDANVQSGKIEQTWSFAGLQGGGGIFNVGSLEELDGIMSRMPLGAFSHIHIYGLVDLKESLTSAKQAIADMMQGA